MLIRNGLIFDQSEKFVNGDITVTGDLISDIALNRECDGSVYEGLNDDGMIDASGLYVIPGLIDIHIHGCVGEDFCECNEKGIEAITEYELHNGITSICPTTMTIDEEKLSNALKCISCYANKNASGIVGINMEGPFVSRAKKAAQNEEYIRRPDIDMFERLYKASDGLIKLCDIAPETDGAFELIKAIKDKVHVSIAHTVADYDTALAAFDIGADHVTHLYNGMNGLHHRNTGVIGAASDYGKAYVEVIGDGVHVSAPAIRIAYKLMGEDRVVLISDSMEATGMPDGEYMLGGQAVTKEGNRAVIKGTETLAGSVTNLMEVFKTVVTKMNIPIEIAVKSVTVNPAKSIGIYDVRGSLSISKKADIVLLDSNLNIIHVIKEGNLIY